VPAPLRPVLAVLAVLALPPLPACTPKAEAPKPQAPPPLHAVAEQFEVGAFAYVRSLRLAGDALYVGTSTGVLKVDRASGDVIRTFSAVDGMRNPYAFVVREGPDGTVWMGTNGGGLSAWRGGGMRNYLPKDGLADLWVYDVAFTPPDTVWLATWDGVNRIEGDPDEAAHWTTYSVADGLANPWVYAVQAGPDGALWFGTEGGLSRLKDGRWTTWRHADGLGGPNPGGLKAANRSGFGATRPGEGATGHSHDLTTLDATGAETYNADYVFSLLMDRDGALWVGTWGGGVARFDGQRFENHTTADGLAGNVVYSIAQGPDGALWFGTNHGISRFDGSRWVTYDRGDGLMGDDVYAIAVDADRVVWAGQKGGVSRLAPLPAHPAPA
jgi:ligand-binding sensor domain-containing protein